MPPEIEERGGLNEEDIHNVLMWYKNSDPPVTDEMLNTHDYVRRFDANQDGLVDRTEVIKLIKWFIRAVYGGSSYSEMILINLADYLEIAKWFDDNADGVLTRDEAEEGFRSVIFEMGGRWNRNDSYFEDYDFNSNGLLDDTELTEFIKRVAKDLY